MRTTIFIMALVFVWAPSYAGTHTEMFLDYSGSDLDRTTARWNIFDQRLELPHTEKHQEVGFDWMVEIAPDDWIALAGTEGLTGSDYLLYRLNDEGMPLWPEPVLIDPGVGQQIGNTSGALLSSGDIVVTWRLENELQAQRYGLDGLAVWPAPVDIKQGGAGFRTWSHDTAAMPDGGFVVAWTDDRTGTDRVYAQRADSSGTVQ